MLWVCRGGDGRYGWAPPDWQQVTFTTFLLPFESTLLFLAQGPLPWSSHFNVTCGASSRDARPLLSPFRWNCSQKSDKVWTNNTFLANPRPLPFFPVCPTFPSTTNPCPKNTKLIDFQTCGMAQGASVNVIARKPSSLKGQPTRDYIYAQLYAHVSSKCCLAWSLHMRNVEVC